jgi:hypothetical protein
MEQTECSKTSAYKLQTLGHYPKESTQHTEHSESLKSKILCYKLFCLGLIMQTYSMVQKSFEKHVKSQVYKVNPEHSLL